MSTNLVLPNEIWDKIIDFSIDDLQYSAEETLRLLKLSKVSMSLCQALKPRLEDVCSTVVLPSDQRAHSKVLKSFATSWTPNESLSEVKSIIMSQEPFAGRISTMFEGGHVLLPNLKQVIWQTSNLYLTAVHYAMEMMTDQPSNQICRVHGVGSSLDYYIPGGKQDRYITETVYSYQHKSYYSTSAPCELVVSYETGVDLDKVPDGTFTMTYDMVEGLAKQVLVAVDAETTWSVYINGISKTDFQSTINAMRHLNSNHRHFKHITSGEQVQPRGEAGVCSPVHVTFGLPTHAASLAIQHWAQGKLKGSE
jgi:hypothetical protein